MNSQRRVIIRRQLWLANPTCCYRKREVLWKFSTLDHVNPRSRGGTDQRSNYVLCCRPCNRRKAAMTAEELGTIADICPEGKNIALLRRRAVAGTSRLRSALRKLFGLPLDWDPVLCTGRGADLSWSISLPPNFVPPRLGLPAEIDIAEASCLSPTQLRLARLRAGLMQKELGILIGVSDKRISEWELAKRPIFREAADKLRRVFGTYLDEDEVGMIEPPPAPAGRKARLPTVGCGGL